MIEELWSGEYTEHLAPLHKGREFLVLGALPREPIRGKQFNCKAVITTLHPMTNRGSWTEQAWAETEVRGADLQSL